MARAELAPRPVHGGLPLSELAELGLDPACVLDLSTSLSPLPAHPSVLRAVRESDLHAYPDPSCIAPRHAIARALALDPTRIVIGHGSVELLWSLVRELAARPAPGRPLLTVSPTFSEPEAAARAHGVPVVRAPMSEACGFAIEAERIDDAIARHRPAAVYLCQPNNPTGTALASSRLNDLIASHPRVAFIVDEAFLSLSTLHTDAAIELPPNAVRMRSLTKDHGLAGLRAGYAICEPALAERLERSRPPWMVSAPTQAAITAAMGALDHVDRVRAELFAHKDALTQALAGLGIATVPSVATFFLADVGDADALRASLLSRHGVLVRSGSSFGLPRHIRLPACLPDARARLVDALATTVERS